MYTFDEQVLSDLHKDAYGFRPRSEWFWNNWNSADNDGKQAIWDDLLEALDHTLRMEKEAEERAIEEFEHRVAETIRYGAGDRATAIRWIVDSLNLSECDKWYGSEYICYTLGLPYSMKNVFDEVKVAA